MMLFNLINIHDLYPNIFDYIDVPDGLDKDIMVNNILLNCGMMEPLYSDPNLLHGQIILFFDTYKNEFSKVVHALNVEYSPIENYDRTEETTRNVNSESFNDTSAYDDSGYVPQSKNTNGNSESYNSRVHGNIGVTTAQQMITSELDLRRKFNPYDFISMKFMEHIMITVM